LSRVNEQPTKIFTQNPVKNFAFCPGQVCQAVAVMPLAAKVLKKVMVNTGGNKRQVPAKRQNRGSRNSKDDGG
ncbi:TPA: single-stranded DNA-binding protein, partial [Escherichia coli]